MKKNIYTLLLEIISIIIISLFISPSLVFSDWKKYENNPILPINNNSWDITHVSSPTIIYENNVIKMWYQGHDGNSWKIGFATSSNCYNFTKNNKPIITPNEINNNILGVVEPSVIKVKEYYEMWFNAFSSYSKYKIYYATSLDGINWNINKTPVLEGEENTWQSSGPTNPSVIFDNNLYHMWYVAASESSPWKIGHAISNNGINWIKDESNPLNIPTLGFVGGVNVVKIDNYFHMFYHTGSYLNTNIYHLISNDLKNWNIDQKLSILSIENNSFDENGMTAPAAMKIGNKICLWYGGLSNSHWQIGLATLTLAEPTPINIILPGLMGSWNGRAILHNDEVSIFDWKIPSFVKEYTGIINSLQNLGYQENQDFFVFPYDWRKPVEQTTNDLNTFLQQKIWRGNPDQKVNLIGHSLGGLVARIFAQKNKDKVNQIISVGSPHQGAVQVYKPLEAGEIDRENTFLWLAQKLILVLNKSTIEPDRETIKKRFPVALDLFPTFNFLKNKNGQEIPINSLSIKNNTLLTYNPTFSQIFDIFTAIYGEKDEQTPAGYKIDSPNVLDQLLGNYPDGKPIEIWYEKGDYTVLSKSANQDNDSQRLSFDHGEIITEKESIKKIFNLLNINYSDDKIVSGQKTKISPSLIFLIQSPAKIKVLFGGQTFEEDDGIIFIPDAQSGEYQLNVEGLEKGKYSVLIGQIGEQNDFWQKIDGEINLENPSSQVDQYLINFNNQNPIISSILPVNLLQSFDYLINYLNQLNQSLKNKKIKKAINDIKEAKKNYQNKKYHLLKINLLSAQKEIISSLNPAKKEVFSSIMEAEENLEDIYYQSLKTSGLKVNQKLIKTEFKVLKETFEKRLKKLAKEKKNNEEKILLVKIVAEKIEEIEKLLDEENYFGAEIKIIGSFQLLLKI